MSRSTQIKIKSLDPSTIPDGSVCVFIGKRKSGKSCAIRDLIWYKRDIPIGQIISGSERANPFFHAFFPSGYIDDECNVEYLDNILLRQTKIKQLSAKSSKKVDPRFLLVLDDCLHDSRWQKTSQMRNIFMNGRHFGIFFILSMQYVIGIPPNLRSNIDYVFIFRDSSLSNRKKLYENFGGSIPSFQLFCTLMDNLDMYESLVICNDADKMNFQEQVMFWKSKIRKPFKFGSPSFWTQNEKLKIMKEQMKTPSMQRGKYYEKLKNAKNVEILKSKRKKKNKSIKL